MSRRVILIQRTYKKHMTFLCKIVGRTPKKNMPKGRIKRQKRVTSHNFRMVGSDSIRPFGVFLTLDAEKLLMARPEPVQTSEAENRSEFRDNLGDVALGCNLDPVLTLQGSQILAPRSVFWGVKGAQNFRPDWRIQETVCLGGGQKMGVISPIFLLC